MTARERYLRQIAFWLPSRDRRATLERITLDLEDHLDDVSDAQWRALSEDEMKAALRAFGAPPIVATRYSNEQPLISGGLMVVYWRVLSLAIFAVFGIQAFLLLPALSLAATGTHGLEITDAGNRTVYGLLMAFTAVTIVFAVLSRLYVPRSKA